MELLTPALVSAVLSITGAVVGGVLSYLAFQLGKKSVEQAASDARFTEAFSTFDLPTIGEYIRSEFGSVALDAYARDEKVRRSFDKALVGIRDFLDADEPQPEIEEEVAELPEEGAAPVTVPTPLSYDLDPQPGDPPALLSALAELSNGNVWNALAKLRRDVEIDIRRTYGESRSVPINSLILRTEMPEDVSKSLRRFYRTASRAVHGENVGFGEAVEALHSARTFYRYLQNVMEARF
jgi:hypothetical protein|tara:strand:- start:39 stop:752 length:714 start_codon:yes stop_codon:yes gene_type:complete